MSPPADGLPPEIAALLEDDSVTFDRTTIELPAADFDGENELEGAADPDCFVGCVVRNDAGELLLVRHADDPHKSGWTMPGGSVEAGESLGEAVRREVREETGVECSVDRPLAVTEQRFRAETDPSLTATGYFVLFEAGADSTSLTDDPGLEEEGITAVGWFDAVPDETPQPDLLERFLA